MYLYGNVNDMVLRGPVTKRARSRGVYRYLSIQWGPIYLDAPVYAWQLLAAVSHHGAS